MGDGRLVGLGGDSGRDGSRGMEEDEREEGDLGLAYRIRLDLDSIT